MIYFSGWQIIFMLDDLFLVVGELFWWLVNYFRAG
jgi:hypothetical protein